MLFLSLASAIPLPCGSEFPCIWPPKVSRRSHEQRFAGSRDHGRDEGASLSRPDAGSVSRLDLDNDDPLRPWKVHQHRPSDLKRSSSQQAALLGLDVVIADLANLVGVGDPAYTVLLL